MSSKSARLRRRNAARLRRIKRLRKCGRLPAHTLTERRRAEAERRREREAGLRRIRRIKQAAAFAAAGVGASIAVELTGLAVPAAESTDSPAAVYSLGLDHLSRQTTLARSDRGEPLHDDGPDITQDGFAAPYIVTGTGLRRPAVASPVPVLYPLSSLYGPLLPSRQDELPHNELPDPAGYPGDSPYSGGTAISMRQVGPNLSGLTAPDWSRRYGSRFGY